MWYNVNTDGDGSDLAVTEQISVVSVPYIHLHTGHLSSEGSGEYLDLLYMEGGRVVDFLCSLWRLVF